VVVSTPFDERGRPMDLKFQASASSDHRKGSDFFDKNGKRVRYFADDDDVDLKTLVAREKMSSSRDYHSNFARAMTRNPSQTEDLDDIDVSRMDSRRKMSKDKLDAILKQRSVHDHKRLEKCWFCYDNSNIAKHLIVSLGEHVYLALPAKQRLVPGHCLIVPLKHVPATTDLDSTAWAEIYKFQECLRAMFATQKRGAVFIETAMNLKRQYHIFIECIPMPQSLALQSDLYFKKAITESETEWQSHKKLYDTRGKGLVSSIPPGFPYFHVDFPNPLGKGGFAHIVEDEKKFSHHFGREVVGGMLELDSDTWLGKQKTPYKVQCEQVMQFVEIWKKFDWTSSLEGGEY